MSNQSILLSLIIYMICVTRSLIAGVVSPCMLSDIYNACSSSSYLVLCVNSACNLKPCHVKRKKPCLCSVNTKQYRVQGETERDKGAYMESFVIERCCDIQLLYLACLGTTIAGFISSCLRGNVLRFQNVTCFNIQTDLCQVPTIS